MTVKVAVNSKTAGKYRREYLNNREHIVTEMVSIVGDSVMNRGLYPLDEVKASYLQLNNLPAPNGHPKVNNENVSAFHPLAMNAYNIGGFIRNPRMDDKKVVNEFWLDIDIANLSDDGKELIRRIEEGEEVGVSTGLTINQEEVQNETEYEWVARDFKFDHVAVLLNEKAAGAHVGTKLQTNAERVLIGFCDVQNSEKPSGSDTVPNAKQPSDGLTVKKFFDSFMSMLKADMTLFKANNLTTDDLHRGLSTALASKYASDANYVWTMAIMPNEKEVVYEVCAKDGSESKLYKQSYSVDEQTYAVTLADGPVEVVKKTEFVAVGSADAGTEIDEVPNEETDMSKEAATAGVGGDKAEGVSVENAIKALEAKGLKVVNAEQAKDLEFFLANRSKIETVINREEDELSKIRANIVANSELTDEDVKGMSRDMLIKINSTVTPAQNYSLGSGRLAERKGTTVSNAEDYEADYTTLATGA